MLAARPGFAAQLPVASCPLPVASRKSHSCRAVSCVVVLCRAVSACRIVVPCRGVEELRLPDPVEAAAKQQRL